MRWQRPSKRKSETFFIGSKNNSLYIMPRIFIPHTSIQEGRISITGEKTRYLTTVLRCGKGDELVIFDGKGNCFRTEILKADRREVLAEVLEKFSCDNESALNIILVQGLLKSQKMDFVIQKATELGVKEIVPAVTERSQPRETRKVSRWQKIAEGSSRQSGRSVIPVIHEPVYFNDWLSSLTPEETSKNGLIFYEGRGVKISGAAKELKQSLKESAKDLRTGNPPSSPFTKGGKRGITDKNELESDVLVVIGPEGGFTIEEITAAENKGLIVTTLGKRILRAETAAISAVTLVQFLLGDLS